MQALPLMRPVALLLAFAGYATAQAQDKLPLTFTASYAVQTDDNPLRIPDDTLPAPGGALPRSEQLGISTLGVAFNTTQGLQQLELDASLVNYHYQSHTSPDYTAHNVAAAWRWAVTPRVRGTLSANQQEIPNAQSGDKGQNQQTQTGYRADLDYALGGPWHVLAGASQDKLTKQYTEAAGQEYSSRSLDAGLRFEQPSGSSVLARVKTTQGTYLGTESNPLNLLDSEYAQVQGELRLHWAFSAASSADLHATALARSHSHVAVRDFSGLNGGASLQWATSARTQLRLRYQHDLAAYPTPNSNYSETDQLAWDWDWETSAKTRLSLGQTFAHIRYRGSPFAQAESLRADDTRDTRLTWTWQPRTPWHFSAGLHQIVRASSEAAQRFSSNQITFSAQFHF